MSRIIIERLSSTASPAYSIGIIEFLLYNLPEKPKVHLFGTLSAQTYLMGDRAIKYLSDRGIELAPYRSFTGVRFHEINQFESEVRSIEPDTRIIYDVSENDLLKMNTSQLRKIIAGREFISTDLIEGCNGVGVFLNASSPLLKIMWSHNIVPANWFYLNGNIDSLKKLKRAGVPNATHLPPIHSFAPITSLNSSVSHLVTNQADKDNHAAWIEQRFKHTPVKEFLSINGKPRPDRVVLLSKMWKAGLLEDSSWSLLYASADKNARMMTQDKMYFTRGHTLNGRMAEETKIANEFLLAHSDILPKTFHSSIPLNQLTAPPLDLSYDNRWYVLLETSTKKWDEAKSPSPHPCIISEKFYKSVLMGMPIIPFLWKNGHQDLKEHGFRLPNIDYSYMDDDTFDERSTNGIKLMSSLFGTDTGYYLNAALDNFEKLTSMEWLIEQVCSPLLDIRKPPV